MSLQIDRIHALCFDVDGTLSDTDDQMIQRLERMLLPLRQIFPKTDVHPFARWMVMGMETPVNILYNLFDRLGLDGMLGHIYSILARSSMSHRPRNYWLLPKVAGMLLKLSGLYPMAIVSARDRQTTFKFLNQFDLGHLFSTVVTSQTCKHTKPFPDPILWAAQQMQVDPEECLMIGDTTVDIRAGKAAGAQTVGVLCGFGHEKELRRAGADLILQSTDLLLGELLPG